MILRTILRSHDVIPPAEVKAIVQLGYLAAEIDLDDDPDEAALLGALGDHLWRAAGSAPEPVGLVTPVPLDREERLAWVDALAGQLHTTSGRELAYVVAYMLTIVDLELAPVEGKLLDELRRALHLTEPRAADLVATAAEIVTPGMR